MSATPETALDPARPPTSAAELLAAARHFPFLQLVLPDIHGHPRSCLRPGDGAEELVTDGADLPLSTLGHTIDGDVVSIADLSSGGDLILRPIAETARAWPWPGKSNDHRVLQVLAQPEWLSGDPVGADPRSMALYQLERLRSRGLDLLWGAECEFRLFEAGGTTCPAPALSSLATNCVHLGHRFEGMYAELDRRMRSMGSRVDGFRWGPELGQMRVSVAPDWGIKAADDVFRLRMMVRDVARESGFRASFMTRPLLEQAGSGFHFCHSVWRRGKEEEEENVLFDPDDVDKLSTFARQWMAGLLHHAGALTAVGCPTVNCYRRLQQTCGPRFASWGSESGSAAVTVKLRSEKRLTVLENRIPSSAANPYLVLAGCVAAGLDGDSRRLELADEGSKEMGALPKTLSHALEALRKDEVMGADLGEQFVEWYLVMKLEEIGKLRTDDVAGNRGTDFENERKLYFNNV